MRPHSSLAMALAVAVAGGVYTIQAGPSAGEVVHLVNERGGRRMPENRKPSGAAAAKRAARARRNKAKRR